jgi:hypothetical protein
MAKTGTSAWVFASATTMSTAAAAARTATP